MLKYTDATPPSPAAAQRRRVFSAPLRRAYSSSRRQWINRFRRRERFWQDHLNIVADHLRIGGRRAFVLAIDEFRRPIWHDVTGECRACKRIRDLGAVGRFGAVN